MTKRYPLHHEDARPMYVNIPIEEYKCTAKKLLDAAADFPGVAHHDLCPDCAKEFAQMFDDFVKANNEANDDR